MFRAVTRPSGQTLFINTDSVVCAQVDEGVYRDRNEEKFYQPVITLVTGEHLEVLRRFEDKDEAENRLKEILRVTPIRS